MSRLLRGNEEIERVHSSVQEQADQSGEAGAGAGEGKGPGRSIADTTTDRKIHQLKRRLVREATMAISMLEAALQAVWPLDVATAPGDVINMASGNYRLYRNTVITNEDSGVTIRGSATIPTILDRGNVNSAQRAFDLQNADSVTLDLLRITV